MEKEFKIAGKIYHCVICGHSQKVEYVGGLQTVDIQYVDEVEFKKRMRKHGVEDYLHIEGGLCQGCFEERYPKAVRSQELTMLWRLHRLIQEQETLNYKCERNLIELVQTMGRVFNNWMEKRSFDDFVQIDAVGVEKIISNCNFEKKGRLKELVNQYIQRHVNTLYTEMLEACVQIPAVAQIITEYKNDQAVLVKEICCIKDALMDVWDDVQFKCWEDELDSVETFSAMLLYPGVYPLDTRCLPVVGLEKRKYYFAGDYTYVLLQCLHYKCGDGLDFKDILSSMCDFKELKKIAQKNLLIKIREHISQDKGWT